MFWTKDHQKRIDQFANKTHKTIPKQGSLTNLKKRVHHLSSKFPISNSFTILRMKKKNNNNNLKNK
jgi:hypothetical protein